MPTILYTLFAMTIFPILLSAWGVYFRKKQFGEFDNNHPRLQQAKLEGAGARIVAAQQNAWEALAMYGSVVFIAYASGVNLNDLTMPAIIFVAARILHPILYVTNKATLRSLSFTVGFFTCVYIFCVAVGIK